MMWKRETKRFWEKKQRRRKMGVALLTASMILQGGVGSFFQPVFATEPSDDDMTIINQFYEVGEEVEINHNERQVDDMTGEAYAFYDDETGKATQVSMDAHCIYQVASYTYIYNYTSYNVDDVRASVYDGMTVNGTVNIEIGKGLIYQLYQNGVKIDYNELVGVKAPGYYMLQIVTENGELEEPLSFTILGESSNMQSWEAPSGFQITGVTRSEIGYNTAEASGNDQNSIGNSGSFIDENGDGIADSYEINTVDEMDSDGTEDLTEAVEESNVQYTMDSVSFEEEGYYVVSYKSLRSGVEYSFRTYIDHTPPKLKLKALNKKNEARGAVSLKDYKTSDAIKITHNGKEIDYTESLTEYGRYHITLQDPAGNVTEYDFKILVYVNGTGIAFVIFFLALIIGMIAYLKFAKKNMRVR